MARKKKGNIVVLTAEEARAQRAAVLAERQLTAEETAQEFLQQVDPERAKKIEKKTKRMEKIEAAAKKEAARLSAIEKLHANEEAAGDAAEQKKVRRMRRYETMKVKVPYDRKIMNFTTPELLELFGGWFTLTYAFSKPVRPDMLNVDGTPVMRDYYICSRDVSAILPSERPKKNAAIKKLFDRDVYGFAIIAPASAFSGKDKYDEEED